ncbi:MAG: GDYXXLXY domain-containing protein [Microcoleaceae cyanobacterium]
MAKIDSKNTQDLQILTSTNKINTKKIPFWRLGIPLLIQLALILSVPAQAVYTYVTGKTVVLQTIPVDPYDFLRGYYQTLNYEISDINTLKTLPGWQEVAGENDWISRKTIIYVTLEQPQNQSNSALPIAWKPIEISLQQPEKLPENQIAIRGESQSWNIKYGVERYYMPEDQREQINDDINQTQQTQPEAFVVEVKVDQNGKAIPLSLWVRERNYRF